MPVERPIKLLTMEYPPSRGGAGVYCEELAHAADEIGFDIEVLAPQDSYSQSSVNLCRFPFKGSQDWVCSWKIRKFLRVQKLHDITLHVAEPGALRAMIRFGWSLPKPLRLIITLHGSEIPKFSKNPLEKLFFRKLIQRSDHIHVLSSFNMNALMKFCPEVEKKIFLIRGAPAREVIPPTYSFRERTYPKDHLVLLYVGRIHPRKGQLEFLHVVKELPSYIKQGLSCHFAGPYTKQGYARRVLEKSKSVGCEVKFLGDLSNIDLQHAYQSADIFALTSIPTPNSVEGFGFVYLEASAHGLPILAHQVGGVNDAVLDGQTGLLSDPLKPDQLKKNLASLMKNHALREKLGKAGVKWATRNNWKDVAQKVYGSG